MMKKMGKTYKAPSDLPVRTQPKKTQEKMAKALVGEKPKALEKHKL